MSAEDSRRLVLVFGVGRSGTSLVTGILGQLGFHIPQPEIQADDTNPRGFGEPEWVVGFHTRLMRRLRVTVFDARPAAWELTAAVAAEAETRDELLSWLGTQLGEADAVVVKDPRIGWFWPLWAACSDALGVPTSSLITLRNPAEILASARTSYGAWQSDASRAASWLNVMLETERATRGTRRVFVRYEDLLADWLGQVRRVGEVLDLPLLSELDYERLSHVGDFVDPTLHRSRVGWEELDVPATVQELADDVWQNLEQLAGPAADAAGAQAALDAARAEYVRLYNEAEAIAQSSVTAAKPLPGRARAKAKADGPPRLAVRLARRLPERHRKRLRRAAGTFRRSR